MSLCKRAGVRNMMIPTNESAPLCLEPGGLVLRLVDQEGLQQDPVSLLAHPQLLSELRGSGTTNIFKGFCEIFS